MAADVVLRRVVDRWRVAAMACMRGRCTGSRQHSRCHQQEGHEELLQQPQHRPSKMAVHMLPVNIRVRSRVSPSRDRASEYEVCSCHVIVNTKPALPAVAVAGPCDDHDRVATGSVVRLGTLRHRGMMVIRRIDPILPVRVVIVDRVRREVQRVGS
jgi:hypothetical protein